MKRYSGKNAWWFILIFILFNLLPLSIFLYNDVKLDLILIIILLFYYGFDFIFIPILVRNYINLYDDYFIIHYGFSKQKVMIDKVLKIEKSRDMIASSANSLDRILIKTKANDFMVSLKNNDDFIEAIRMRNS